MQRKVIHIDMDAFYASVEQRDFPEFRNIPLAVGGSPEGRGVIATASYEARKFGVKSAMSSQQALKLCPHLIFAKPRFEAYKEVSNHIRSIFYRYTDLVEPLSLDEAYLDVTYDKLGIGSAIEIARQIKDAIFNELNLTASAGVSINKFVAKIASDLQKPNGLTFIGPSKIIGFLENLPVDKFYGVGKVTAQKMHDVGIFTGYDLKMWKESELVRLFGKSGAFFYHIVRGIDNREVVPLRVRKSVGIEDTFMQDIEVIEEMIVVLQDLAVKLIERLKKAQKSGKTLTLKIKFADFTLHTRSQTVDYFFANADQVMTQAKELLSRIDLHKSVRLLGLTISNFKEDEIEHFQSRQLKIDFPDEL